MLNAERLMVSRFPGIERHSPFLMRPLRVMLARLFHMREQNLFQRQYPHLQGMDFVDQVLEYFDFSYTVQPREIERIPAQGRVVVVANHPLGTLDAMVLLKLMRQVRPDVRVVANQLLAGVEPLESLLLPVDNMDGRTSRRQLKAVYRHLEDDGAVIIFPAGEVSRLGPTGIRDGKWHRGFLSMATATRSPILPVHVQGRNSMFFYALSLLARPLSSLWLIREMFKQTSHSVSVSIGEMVLYESYQAVNLPQRARVKLFQKHVYRIGRRKEPIYETSAPVAHPEPRDLLRQEIQRCQRLGQIENSKTIYLFPFHPDSCLMREIGRLREIAFRAAGEGTGRRRDIDRYDRNSFQLLLWDESELEIVGAYRMRKTCGARYDGDELYSQSLFAFGEPMQEVLQQGLELGRSFVQPRYWGRRSLDYLWYGIGAFLRNHPEIRYLFGPVSISDTYPPAARDMLVYFYHLYFGDNSGMAQAMLPYCLDATRRRELARHFTGKDYKRDFMHLKGSLKHLGCSVPTLYKQYSEICAAEGVRFLDFNIDPDFANCVDALVVMDLEYLKDKPRQRYIDNMRDY